MVQEIFFLIKFYASETTISISIMDFIVEDVKKEHLMI